MSDHQQALPEFTKSQLALRNGQDKPQIWIALHGVIYDVTDSGLWRGEEKMPTHRESV